MPNVLAVRGGYKFVDGAITSAVAVVVAVDRKQEVAPADTVPPILPDGMPTDVTPADPWERLTATRGATTGLPPRQPLLIRDVQAVEPETAGNAVARDSVPPITYRPPAGVSLDPVTGPMSLTCHVSPDAGWRVLRPFIREARSRVTVGMYDFTAPHIYRAVRRLLRDKPVRWQQTLGPHASLPSPHASGSAKANDKPEPDVVDGLEQVGGNRFRSVFASVGPGMTFAFAYHIKVVVRDGKSLWLSSGNWQSSNQPVADFIADGADLGRMRSYNREWHIVIHHPGLAATFERFLLHDFDTARREVRGVPPPVVALPDLLEPIDEALAVERAPAAPEAHPPQRLHFRVADPLTIQPILTPDNYTEVVLDLLRRRPRRRLYFQNQSIRPALVASSAWKELIQLLADRSNDRRLDVRIIFRDIGDTRKKIESLKAAGFAMERVRHQVGCHTKGIVIDGTTVLLGSHNWTEAGVRANRDASLLIRRAEIARYYEKIFLHDWDRLARSTVRERAMPIPLAADTSPAALTARDGRRFRRISWSDWEEE